MRQDKEDCLARTIVYSITQVKMMYVLGHPYQKETVLLSFGWACFRFLPVILWNVLFVVYFVYTFVSIVQLTQSWAFRVPILGMLCLNFFYGLFKWLINAAMFNVLCYSVRINGALFMSLWVLGYLLLYVLVLFLRGDVKEKVEKE